MVQDSFGHRSICRGRHGSRLFERGQRTRGAQHDQIGAQAIHGSRNAQCADMRMHGVIESESRQRGTRGTDPLHLRRLLLCVGGAERLRIQIEAEPGLDDLLTHERIETILQFDHQSETVDQLRPQLAFLRIHRPNQHEARFMAVRDAVTLDRVHAARGRVEQCIDERIRQQIDFIDI